MRKAWQTLLFEAVPLGLYLLAASIQLFGPNPMGLGDNGDFPKLLGPERISIAPAHRAEQVGYFVTEYVVDQTEVWDPGIPTLEHAFAHAAKFVARFALPKDTFDMRILGALHLLAAAGAFWFILHALRPLDALTRGAVAALSLLIFSDAAYIEFFSTPLMDAGGTVTIMLVFGIALNVSFDRHKLTFKWAILFALAACAFLGMKLQYQPCAVLLALFCWMMGFRAVGTRNRRVWLAVPIAFIFVAAWQIIRTPEENRAQAAFSALFFKLLPQVDDPQQVLLELGRPLSDLQYIHIHAFSPGSPLTSLEYRSRFAQDASPAKLLELYLRHPRWTARIVWTDYVMYSQTVPLGDYGSMRKVDNPTPKRAPERFTAWSRLKRGAHRLSPRLLIAAYLSGLLTALAVPQLRPMILLLTGISILALLVGSLGDGTDTARHILLYQQTADMLAIVLAIALVRFCSRIARRTAWRPSR